MDVNISNVGLYSGNVIIEYNTDQKVVKPVVKVNEKATKAEINNAVNMALYALKQSTLALLIEDVKSPEPLNQVSGMPMYDSNDEVLTMKDAGTESHTQ